MTEILIRKTIVVYQPNIAQSTEDYNLEIFEQIDEILDEFESIINTITPV